GGSRPAQSRPARPAGTAPGHRPRGPGRCDARGAIRRDDGGSRRRDRGCPDESTDIHAHGCRAAARAGPAGMVHPAEGGLRYPPGRETVSREAGRGKAKMTTFRLGINTCFAVKRWPDPESWVAVVRDLGL